MNWEAVPESLYQSKTQELGSIFRFETPFCILWRLGNACNWLSCVLLTEVMRADIYLNFLATGLQMSLWQDFTWNHTKITVQARNTYQALRFEGLSCSSVSPLAYSRVSHWLQWSEKELFTQSWLHWKDVNLKSVWVTPNKGHQKDRSKGKAFLTGVHNHCWKRL